MRQTTVDLHRVPLPGCGSHLVVVVHETHPIVDSDILVLLAIASPQDDINGPHVGDGTVQFRDFESEEDDPTPRYCSHIRYSQCNKLCDMGLLAENDPMDWHTTLRITELGRRVLDLAREKRIIL